MRLGTPPSRASVRNRREQTKRAGERLGASCLRPAIDLRIALGRCPGIIAGPCTSAISPMEYTCRAHPTRSSRGVTYSTSFDCKQPTGELSGEQVDEHRVRDEIALPELARLLRKSPRPFEPSILKRLGRTSDKAREHIEGAGHAQHRWRTNSLAVLLAPDFLERGWHAQKQQIGAAFPNLACHVRVVLALEIAVARARDRHTRIFRADDLHQAV